MASQRRQIIILAVLAALVVVLFVVGVGAKATRSDPVGNIKNWTGRLNGVDPGKSIDPTLLHTAGKDCHLNVQGQLTFSEQCLIAVPAAGGRFSLSSRRLSFERAAASFSFQTTVEGTEMKGTVNPGDEPKRVGFGRDAAQLELTCLTSCAVSLAG